MYLVLDLALLAGALGAHAFAGFTLPGVGSCHYDSLFLLPTHFSISYTNAAHPSKISSSFKNYMKISYLYCINYH